MLSSWPSRAAAFCVVLLATYYWRFTHVSLQTGFSQDDLMNLYFAWREPIAEVLKANLFLRTPVVRPFGALVYVTSLHFWGFDGFSMRVICYAVLWLNLLVAYWLTRRLTGSREAALIAVLLHCVHGSYFPLYYGSGSCYDVFSFFFYCLALALSVRARSEGRVLSGIECSGLGVLFVCAVNSKEAAASLPAMLLGYELLFRGTPSLSWVWREGRGVVVTGCIALAFLWARFTGPNNLLGHPDYTPVFTLNRYLECTAHYLSELSARSDWWTPWSAGLLLAGMAAVALVARSRVLGFAWLLVVLGAAPMAFVSPRGLSAYYIPILGYAQFAAVGIVRTRELLFGATRMQRPIAVASSQAILFAAMVAGMWQWQAKTERHFPDYWVDLQRIQSAAMQFRSHPEWFRAGSSILILNDPFGEYEWATTFIAGVVGNERSVSMQKRMQHQALPKPEQLARFGTVIAYKNQSYFEVDRRSSNE
jgi:hypothetical protein